MKLSFLSILLTVINILSFGQTKPAYIIFDNKAKESSYQKLLNEAQDSDIIIFGELHNNPICHWLQLELTKDLYEFIDDSLVLGAEMFEADNQLLLDEYIYGKINEKNFKNEVKLWSNYDTDYKPLVEFSRDKHLCFIASNIPRRYASLVFNNGLKALDSLDSEAYKFIPPLPFKIDISLKSYQDLLKMEDAPHSNENMPYAQAVKDATMAYFILKNWTKNKLFLHFNGAYHSNNYEGIVWHLKQRMPDLNILTISTVEQENIDILNKESINIADFIICVPENMTKTH